MPPRKKQTCNISGLKNQGAKSTQSLFPIFHWILHILPLHHLRVDWSQEEQDTDKLDIDSELESGDDYEFNTEDGLDAMKILSKKLAYDDLEWLPSREAQRPKTYATGPDILKKALQTQRCYRKVMITQTQLDSFLSAPRSAPSSAPIRRASASPEQVQGKKIKLQELKRFLLVLQLLLVEHKHLSKKTVMLKMKNLKRRYRQKLKQQLSLMRTWRSGTKIKKIGSVTHNRKFVPGQNCESKF
ncbi:hypothetical protein DFH08DRAFT_809279 [Mycena albidolilacea]|uniref:Uncharacterized protein n=1 Tax=Mycena albidolilacea TaxID=1033008 RepID=A0AAD7ESX4_9AGAR|nr:hypothetical protein DFH08DRAFT_809279 [Mycena albidolilacea]